jgi:hypothetical protein
MRIRRRGFSTPSIVTLALTASACTTWRAEMRPLPAPLDGDTLPQIRVFTRNRQTIVVYEARLAGDSIVGFSLPRRDPNASRVAIPTRDVAEVSYLATDGAKTTVAVAVLVVGVLLFAIVASCASSVSGY